MSAIVLLVAAWAAAFAVVAGIGSILARALRRLLPGPATFESWFAIFWLGFAGLVAALQLWHLVLPIDWRATVFFAVTGGIGAAYRLRGRRTPPTPSRSHLVAALVVAPALLWLVLDAIGAPTVYDSGLYHFNSIRWANEYAIVPGLGNLHGRLAFNQSFFLFAALLNVHPWLNAGYHVAASLLMVVLLIQLSSGFAWVWRDRDGVRPAVVLRVLLFVSAIAAAKGFGISSPAPDAAVFVVGAALILYFVEFLFEPEDDRRTSALVIVSALAALGLTIKASMAVLSGTVVLLAFVTFFHRRRDSPQVDWRIVAGALGIPVVLGISWAARGVITSGYIAYPSTMGAFPVDWRVPAAQAINEANWIRSWARLPEHHWNEVLGDWSWFGPWLDRVLTQQSVLYPLAALAFGTVASGILMLFRQRTILQRSVYWLPVLPLVSSLAFWFWAAPDPRFLGAALWALGAWVCVPFARWLASVRRSYAVLGMVVAPVLISAVLVAENSMYALWKLGVQPHHVANRAVPEFRTGIPRPELTRVETASGLRLVTPASGDQVWDSGLPATPYPDSGLELRGRSLQDGFRKNCSQSRDCLAVWPDSGER